MGRPRGAGRSAAWPTARSGARRDATEAGEGAPTPQDHSVFATKRRVGHARAARGEAARAAAACGEQGFLARRRQTRPEAARRRPYGAPYRDCGSQAGSAGVGRRRSGAPGRAGSARENDGRGRATCEIAGRRQDGRGSRADCQRQPARGLVPRAGGVPVCRPPCGEIRCLPFSPRSRAFRQTEDLRADRGTRLSAVFPAFAGFSTDRDSERRLFNRQKAPCLSKSLRSAAPSAPCARRSAALSAVPPVIAAFRRLPRHRSANGRNARLRHRILQRSESVAGALAAHGSIHARERFRSHAEKRRDMGGRHLIDKTRVVVEKPEIAPLRPKREQGYPEVRALPPF